MFIKISIYIKSYILNVGVYELLTLQSVHFILNKTNFN